MQVIKDFTLRVKTLVCPACNSMFGSPVLATMPAISSETQIETDLHRILPSPEIRAALVAMCAACTYTWWTTAFKSHSFNPKFVPPAPDIEHAKKFAHAVLTGRQNQVHALDLALLALNGLWCAREANKPYKRWLDLAGQELEKALQDDSWDGNRSYYRYILGELCRLSGDFKGAVKNLKMVGPESNLPGELIQRQKVQATSGDDSPSLLPAHLIDALFCAGGTGDISTAG